MAPPLQGQTPRRTWHHRCGARPATERRQTHRRTTGSVRRLPSNRVHQAAAPPRAAHRRPRAARGRAQARLRTRAHDAGPPLATIFAAALTPDACCIDVGAHTGDVLAEIIRIAPRGHHLGFEPLPALATALRKRLPGVDVRNVALGDATGTVPFIHVLDRPGWSGLKARPTPEGDAPRTETIEVTVERLDDALPDGYAPALVKIDVEGAELGVLHGARATLAAHHPLLVFEHGLGSADHHGTGPGDIHDFLCGLDYRVFDLQGHGPYDRAAFVHTFSTAARVNFLARL
jgi:FkbM family methyltransferase